MDPSTQFADHLAAALRGALEPVVKKTEGLRDDLHSAEAARRRANLINLGVLAVLIVLVVGLVVVTATTLRVAAAGRQTNAAIADCTTAGGRCYEQGRRQTGTAVDAILRADVYVTECARRRPGDSGPAFDQFLEACVAAKLAADQPGLSPGPSPSPSPSVSPTG